jgi:cell division protein FtsQ
MTRLRWAAILVVTAAVLAAPLWGPPLLRRIAWFGVERVEIAGTRLIPAHEVLAASGIRLGESVWSDAGPWRDALLAHPGIEGATITRRLPATLRVRVQEKRPVAYVLDRSLRPATREGELFPLDPSAAPLDLPLVHGAWPDTAESGVTRTLLREVGRLAELDPGLVSDVSEVRAGDAAATTLLLTHRLGEIVLTGGISTERLAELRAVLADLERRDAAAGAGQRPRVDARFEAQIVVRLTSSA